jgi:hypothetical protein
VEFAELFERKRKHKGSHLHKPPPLSRVHNLGPHEARTAIERALNALGLNPPQSDLWYGQVYENFARHSADGRMTFSQYKAVVLQYYRHGKHARTDVETF